MSEDDLKKEVPDGIDTDLEQDLEVHISTISKISHEIRSHIHGISAISQFLDENWGKVSEAERQKQVKIILSNSKNLQIFLDKLIDFSKYKSGRMCCDFSVIDLISVMHEVIDKCQNLYLFNNTNLKIITELKKIDKVLVQGDSLRMNQVLFNLFNNAIKYTEKGLITAKFHLVQHNENDYWQFELHDEGLGLSNDELESIFEPFAQSSKTRGRPDSTGLGLSICREIINLHNGKIWAENGSSNNGAIFSFILPAVNQ